MAWYSILPSNLSSLETFLIRVFIFLGICSLSIWAVFFIYDLLLYVSRLITFYVPFIGGRASGRQRPRAPSLHVRPDGTPRRRAFSIMGGGSGAGTTTAVDGQEGDASASGRKRGHRKKRSSVESSDSESRSRSRSPSSSRKGYRGGQSTHEKETTDAQEEE